MRQNCGKVAQDRLLAYWLGLVGWGEVGVVFLRISKWRLTDKNFSVRIDYKERESNRMVR